MDLFNLKKTRKEKILNGLLNVKDKKELFDGLTSLQNEISVAFNTKVVAVAAINDDDLSANFAKAFADAYSLNGLSCLIIDANLYNQKLCNIVGDKSMSVELKEEEKQRQFISLDGKVDAWCLENEIYPSTVYKSGLIQKVIKDNKDRYDHFVLIVPSLKEHKEISLLSDVIDSIIIVTQKNVTIKQRIFEAIQYLKENKMPLAKTVVLK